MGDNATASDTLPWEPDKSYFKLNLKGTPGYEATLVNIGGSTPGELRRAINAFFGWDDDESLALVDLCFNATQTWHAMNSIGQVFEGSRVQGHRRGSKSNASAAYAAAQQEEQAPPDPKAVLLAEVESQTSVVDLKKLYAKNKEAFDNDADLLAAYKAKGKALSK